MAKSVGRVQIQLEALTERFEREINKANKTNKRMAAQMKKSSAATRKLNASMKASERVSRGFSSAMRQAGAAIVGLLALRQLSRVFKTFITNASDAELATKKLTVALKGNVTEVAHNIAALTAQAKQLDRVTAFSETEITDTMRLLTVFGVTPEKMKASTLAVLEFSTALGVDVASAARTLGKSLGGTLGELAEAGDEFKRLSKAELAAGRAFSLTLELMGGQAAGVLETMPGKVKDLGNAYEVFSAEIGNLLIQQDGLAVFFDTLNEGLRDPDNIRTTAELIGELAEKAGRLWEAYKKLGRYIPVIGLPILAGEQLDALYDRRAAARNAPPPPAPFGTGPPPSANYPIFRTPRPIDPAATLDLSRAPLQVGARTGGQEETLFGMSEAGRLEAEMAAAAAIRQEELGLAAESNTERFERMLAAAGDASTEQAERTKTLENAVLGVATAFETQLTSAIMTGKFSFQDFARSAVASVVQIITRMLILKAIMATMSFFGGGGGHGTAAPNVTMTPNTFSPTPLGPGFASGGIVSGRTSLVAGEAGPEAIIPLTRKGGRLGIAAPAGGGPGAVTVNVNNSAPHSDAESQKLGALVARSVREAWRKQALNESRPGGLLNPVA